MNQPTHIPIMKSEGRVLTLFEPPANIDELHWKGPDKLKEEFLAAWKTYHKLEFEHGANEGINQLSVLHDMQTLLLEQILYTSKDFDTLYKETVRIYSRQEFGNIADE
mgnify:CR=1 FL=1